MMVWEQFVRIIFFGAINHKTLNIFFISHYILHSFQINTNPMKSIIGYIDVLVPPNFDDNTIKSNVVAKEGTYYNALSLF